MARKMIKEGYSDHAKRCIGLLILVQVACILLDLPFIVLTYTEIFLFKATLTSFVYAIKLKLEFLILNQLAGVVSHAIAPRGVHATDEEQAPAPSTRRLSAAACTSKKCTTGGARMLSGPATKTRKR